MKYKFSPILIVFITLVSCKTKKEIVDKTDDNLKERLEIVKRIDTYINGIDGYVYHINMSSKDFDSISVNELKSFRKKSLLTKNITEKSSTLYRNKIVKYKLKDYLENNFVKLKSFYYDEDMLVCIKIFELYPSDNLEGKIYKRNFYYQNKELIYDSQDEDSKYKTNDLLSFADEQLKEEYQSMIK